jgi:hypothetical protein
VSFHHLYLVLDQWAIGMKIAQEYDKFSILEKRIKLYLCIDPIIQKTIRTSLKTSYNNEQVLKNCTAQDTYLYMWK